MVDFFERETAVRFFLGPYPDYRPEAPGATATGRAICAEPFDGRLLGKRLNEVRPPVRELTLFGIKVGSGPDFRHFANAQHSLRSALYVAGRVAIHLRDMLLYGRDVKLMSGNALVGRLLRTADDLGIPIWRSCAATALIRDGGRVIGIEAIRDGHPVRLVARHGVALTAGGFSHDRQRRDRLFRHLAPGQTDLSLSASGNTGDGANLAEAAGAAFDDSYASPAAWMPVSRVPYADGSQGVYPHSFDRGKPGAVAVTAEGLRFVNESNSYHDVGGAIAALGDGRREASAWLVCDADFIRRYGLGMAKPFPVPLRPYLKSGYLKRGGTIAALAEAARIDAANLRATVEAFNRGAADGSDPQFRRGENVYNRYNGDARYGVPNPCLAPLRKPPFYAVKIYAGDLNTFMGIRTDAHARALAADGTPIPGLYAAGADMASLFAGHYPGPGTNLGPAMTFGYIIAKHVADTAASERTPGAA
ncbi:MAG: FAD-binding protein, partial [Alphaproteobacteria bacterium]